MEQSRLLKFNAYVRGLLAFLRTSMPAHKEMIEEAERNFELANTMKPRVLKEMFNDHVRLPFSDRINACDSTLIYEIGEKGKDEDITRIYDLWSSPDFTDIKKAQCFQYLIQICDNCY